MPITPQVAATYLIAENQKTNLMSEQVVKIVKIRGKGAGVESIREVPLTWWKNANQPQSGLDNEIADWKIVPDKDSGVPVYIEPISEKSPEEIMEEAQAVLSDEKQEKSEQQVEKKTKKSKAVDAKI